MRHILGCCCLALVSAVGMPAVAQTPASTPAEHAALEAELESFRTGLFHAFNQGEYRRMVEEYCHPNVIATWQDGTSCQGYDGVLAEFDKLKQFIDSMQVNPTTDHRLVLNDGKLVVSSGNMRDDYGLSRGYKVTLNSRWCATLVKENDRWQLISFGASTNAFDNQVVELYVKGAKYQAGGVAGAAGVILGGLLMFLLTRRRAG